jgi:transposase
LEEQNAELKKRIETLEKRIEQLERLLGMNSQNSSKPPSSDPPGISAVLPRPRPKKRGAKNGHQRYLRELLRHQIVDIPPIRPEVIEYI